MARANLLRTNPFVALCFLAVGIPAVIGCWPTHIEFTAVAPVFIVLLVLFAAYSPLPLYWHQKGRIDRRDAALVIPWCLLIWFLGPVPMLVASRLNLPLRDDSFFAFDRLFGFDGHAIVLWAGHNALGAILNKTYGWLYTYLEIAVVIPALLGRRESVRFLLANTMALVIGIVMLGLLPAIGPWIPGHWPVAGYQIAEQKQIMALRTDRVYMFSLFLDGAGIIAFPSFHVIWAVFSASALWGFRWLRIPLAIFSTMIVLSTLTTGWHYLADVVAGLVVAALCLWAAEAMLVRTSAAAQVAPAAVTESVVPVTTAH